MLTLLEIEDVTDKPLVKLDLPGPLRIGDRVKLAFCLRRNLGGRSEVLEVYGEYKVLKVDLDCSHPERRQTISVSSTSTTAHWRAVRKKPVWKRTLPPAKNPRTRI